MEDVGKSLRCDDSYNDSIEWEENDPKKDQEDLKDIIAKKGLNFILRVLSVLLLLLASRYLSWPSAIFLILVYVHCPLYFPIENHYLFYWTDVFNMALVLSYGFYYHRPSVAGGLLCALLYGLSTFSNMACFYYLFAEEILKEVLKIIDCVSRIFSSNPRESDKGEELLIGQTTIQDELPQSDEDVAEDEANNKWEEVQMLEEESSDSSNGSSDSSEDAHDALMEQLNQFEHHNNTLGALASKFQAYEEDSREWEGQKNDLFEKINTAIHTWEGEKIELNAKLTAITNLYQSYQQLAFAYESNVHGRMWDEERSTISAKLVVATEFSESYKARLLDSEETCRTLKEQNAKLAAKLLVETSSAEYLQKRVHEFEEKCRVLEVEKNDLTIKLCTATASSELYQSLLRNH